MLNAQFTQHLRDIIAEFDKIVGKAKYDDLSDAPHLEIKRINMRGQHAIERITGKSSSFSAQVDCVLKQEIPDCVKTTAIFGIANALLSDIEAGYLQSIEELIHGSVFGDFLEMADYLLEEHYKDAAAVIAGSTLEGHLRQLCDRFDISTTVAANETLRPKKADSMNAELIKCGAYNQIDGKSVTSWLDLRNKAAHGRYSDYQPGQVQLMIAGIRDFISRVPA